jgi:hypothetical protein
MKLRDNLGSQFGRAHVFWNDIVVCREKLRGLAICAIEKFAYRSNSRSLASRMHGQSCVRRDVATLATMAPSAFKYE